MSPRWTIWPLIFSFCLQALGQTLIIGRFYIHRAEIERTLCENRAKPELKCHGKCHLKKQLAASPAGEEQPQTTPEIREWILGLPTVFPGMSELLISLVRHNFRVRQVVSASHLPDVFHPPWG